MTSNGNSRNWRFTDGAAVDVVVIGSGPGGAVTAARCAEAGLSTLMIEEGAHHPVDSAPPFSQREFLQKYRNAGVSVAVGRRKLAFVEGRCVGGGSEINRGLYHRAPAYVLDDWARQLDIDDLSLASLTPHFEACEATARVEYLSGDPPGISSRLHAGAKQLGWSSIEAPRLFRYDGLAGGGRKQSMSETFVPRFLRAGGCLMADTRAQRLRLIAGKWHIDARYTLPSGAVQMGTIVTDQVFVACGAVQSAALLRRSGITHNVGNTLRFHPMLKIVAQFDDLVNSPGALDPVHQIKEFEPKFGMGCSISQRPLLAMTLAGRAGHSETVEQDWQAMGIYYVQTIGGVATVRNLPGFADPFLRVRWTAEDLTTLAEGLTRLAEVLFAAGAVRLYPAVAGYPILASMDDVRNLPRCFKGTDGSITSVHVFASCPMGENRALTATNSFGRVHGADGLYLADASILGGPTIVNPQGTVMAIAHRNVTTALERKFK